MRPGLWLTGAGLVLVALVRAGAYAAEAHSFPAALDAQTKGDFETAESTYVGLIEQFGPDPTVYFNLALLCEAQERFGVARAYLERALQLAPRDRAIREELSRVIARCEQPEAPPRSWLHALGRWAVCRVTVKEALAGESLLFALGVGGLGLLLVRPAPLRWLKIALVAAGVVWLLLCALAASKLWGQLGPQSAIVAAHGAALRTGPGEEFGEVAHLPEGCKARVLGRSRCQLAWPAGLRPTPDDGALWLELQLDSGAGGFVSRAALMLI